MNRDKEMGTLARRVFECLWVRFPQALKDTLAWDMIAFGEMQPSTEKQCNELIETILRSEEETK